MENNKGHVVKNPKVHQLLPTKNHEHPSDGSTKSEMRIFGKEQTRTPYTYKLKRGNGHGLATH
jgi:hypothetical protein